MRINPSISESSHCRTGAHTALESSFSESQERVVEAIVAKSHDLSLEDRAILLSIGYVESGLSTDAKNPRSSAQGLFQMTDATAKALGLSDGERNALIPSIEAMKNLLRDHATLVSRRFPGLRGDDRAAMIYAIHHDGPALAHGGVALARSRFIPILHSFRSIVGSLHCDNAKNR